jgi:hypothetical protein
LAEHGFTDLATLTDTELLSDDILLNTLKLKKLEVRKLRSVIASENQGKAPPSSLTVTRTPRQLPQAAPQTAPLGRKDTAAEKTLADEAARAEAKAAAASKKVADSMKAVAETVAAEAPQEERSSSPPSSPELATLEAFLAGAGLEHFASAFTEFGYGDPVMVCASVADEAFLTSSVGLSKAEVKLLKGLVEASGLPGPSMSI